MRVLISPFPRSWGHSGGHRTQQWETARALREAGCDVVIAESELASDGFDIVHFFGSPPPVVATRRHSAKLVVSPVYFPSRVTEGRFPRGVGVGRLVEHHLRRATSRVARLEAWREHQRRVRAQLDRLAAADGLILNSKAEGALLRKDWPRGLRLPPTFVAYSGVNTSFAVGDQKRGREIVGAERFVLCVGRIEPVKNQLGLCQALREMPVPVVLVGETLPGNEYYEALCLRANPRVRRLGVHSPSELTDIYAAASVHALVSWYETTGLATLEAMSAGVPVVASDTPCVREYFGASARLVRPWSARDIRGAVNSALTIGPLGTEHNTVRRYSWSATAESLLCAYESLLSPKGRQADDSLA